MKRAANAHCVAPITRGFLLALECVVVLILAAAYTCPTAAPQQSTRCSPTFSSAPTGGRAEASIARCAD